MGVRDLSQPADDCDLGLEDSLHCHNARPSLLSVMVSCHASPSTTPRRVAIDYRHLLGSFPRLPSPTGNQQNGVAVVRRFAGGVDHLHAVFPSPAVRRLSLCALANNACTASFPRFRACFAARFGGPIASDSTTVAMGAHRLLASGTLFVGDAGRPCRSALLCVDQHRAASAGMAGTSPLQRRSWSIAFGDLSAVRVFQYRFLISPGQLPVLVRTPLGSR